MSSAYELYVTNDASKLAHLQRTFPKLKFHVRKSAPGHSTTHYITVDLPVLGDQDKESALYERVLSASC